MTVLGVNELLARFARAAAVGEAAQTATADALASDVAELAQALAPVETGTLRDSITADGNRVYTDVAYAAFVEYGTSTHEAEPYMRPAADTVDHTHADAVGSAVLRGI